MTSCCCIFLCFLHTLVVFTKLTYGIRRTADDLASCDCDVYRQIIRWSDDVAKPTRVYSTSTKPPSHTTTSHTTYVTRPTTVTPIYLSKVSSLIFPSSSTTTSALNNDQMSKEPRRFVSSSTSTTTSTRITTTSTTPTTSFGSSSTTPSSYTKGTFSLPFSSTPFSTYAYSLYPKWRLSSSSSSPSVAMATRTRSTSTERPTREYTSTTGRTRMTTTSESLLPFRMKGNKNDKLSSNKNKKLSEKCIEFCRARTTNLLSNLANSQGDLNDLYREQVIDEVPLSVDLTIVVTADFSPELYEPTSAVYRYVVAKFNDLLVTVYNSTKGFQGLTIRRLRKGSIICEYTISLILQGNGSVSDSVLESLYDVEWGNAYLPGNIGKIDISSTRTIQGRQLEEVAKQLKNTCSLIGHKCIKQGRICLNDQHRGQATCALPCSAKPRGDAEVSCVGGRCFLDDSGHPKCVCDAGNTCGATSGMSALFVLSCIGAGMAMLFSVVIGLIIYFCFKHRSRPSSKKRFSKQDYGVSIKISVVEDLGLKATTFHI